MKCVGITHAAVTTDIAFDDGTALTLSVSELPVHDCRYSDVPVIDKKGGFWTVNGRVTDIPVDSNVPDASAIPVYVYYTADNLTAVLNNCRVFSIPFEKKLATKRLPVVYIATENGAEITSKEDYVNGRIEIKDPDHFAWDEDVFTAEMKIRGRGNSTWNMFPKKPWKVKLAEKARLFNISNDKEWALLANYCEKTLLRNRMAMELSKILGFSWTPKSVPVEIYLNDEYQGVYDFFEHKKVSKERINIDVDGGDMMFELEELMDNPVCFKTKHGAPVMFSEPEEPSGEQLDFATGLFDELETALWAHDFKRVYEIIDVDSFVNNFIIQELTRNGDANLRKSVFLTLPKGGKMEMYFVWDFDLSLGNCGLGMYDGWWVKDYGAAGKDEGWYCRLFEDPEFVAKVQRRWKEVYPQFRELYNWIDVQAVIMDDAQERNFRKWDILGIFVMPNYKVTGSYEGEIQWLKDFYWNRLEWLNVNLNTL